MAKQGTLLRASLCPTNNAAVSLSLCLSAFSQSLLSYSFERRRRRLVAVASAIAQRAHQSTSSQSSAAQSTGRYFVPLRSLSRRKGSSWSFWTALYPLWRASSKISIRLLFRFNFWTFSMPEVIVKPNFLLVCISAMISHESYSSKPGNYCLYLLRYDNACLFYWSQILSGSGSTGDLNDVVVEAVRY